MLKHNEQMRQGLDCPKQAKVQEAYARPVTQVEEDSMDFLFQELVHPIPEAAEGAKQRLIKLGLSEEKVDKLTQKIQEELKKKNQQVLFGNKDSLAELLKEAKQELVQNATADINSLKPSSMLLSPFSLGIIRYAMVLRVQKCSIL